MTGPRKVLFVCVQNAARSQMAEAIFNSIAPPGSAAESAGVRPAQNVNPAAVQVLREIGLDISTAKPKRLDSFMLESAERIVSMGCDSEFCPTDLLSLYEEWDIADPKGKTIEEIREIRDTIRRQVKELVRKLITT